ncbi:MAG TPA: homoserine dehydrogenase [Candidatus Bathyarchaeia archaeon]|nr:homoserine dehydrogenase [Candidatus Bathyarchaeia archaeon]
MRVIIVGFGTVGQSFARIIQLKGEWLKAHYGIIPQVVAIVDRGGALVSQDGVRLADALSSREESGTVAAHDVWGQRSVTALNVINDVEADVLLELTPTHLPDGEPGLTHVESAIKKGLSVVTTNKGPLAVAMPSLIELAQYQQVQIRFSGTVGGGTPILNFAKECLDGDQIESVQGILNGTTNYILTRIFEAGIPMGDAVKEAQQAGYAEADPTLDVSGLDTACKLVIISNWIMGRRITIKDVEVEGISKLTQLEILDAKREGKAVKLVGIVDESSASVRPRPVDVIDPLCVNGTLNSIVFKTELAGKVTLIGAGAGGRETATAVLRDLIDIKKMLLR